MRNLNPVAESIRKMCPNPHCENGWALYHGTTDERGDDPTELQSCPICRGRGWVSYAEYVRIMEEHPEWLSLLDKQEPVARSVETTEVPF